MKAFLKFLFVFAITCIPYVVMAQEYYFRFIEKDKDRINTIVTSTVSIDNLRSDTVYAYANPLELEAIKKLGYKLEILPHPSSLTKNRIMATTVDEMADWDRYPTYEVYREMMKKFEKDYPALCKLDSIGTSIQGRKLYVVKISDNVLEEEAEPEFFYTSTMHGDETAGYILMLRLIDYLLSNYGVDARVTNLVNNIAIFINPNANPDGTYYGGNHTVDNARRSNANSKDLNRNFPDPRVGSNPDGAHQPETVAMMNFAEGRNFVLSANFHGGIELVNYPWDTWTSSANSHADHNWFYTISRQYADFAQANSPSGYFTAMDNGVTHGGDWYVITGGRQDYMNYWRNCREITLEISNTKNPASGDLPNYWDYNMEAMLSYMELVFTGIQGTVTNSSGEPLDAIVSIAGHDKDNSHVVTNPLYGNYIRLIEPSLWTLKFSANGYEDSQVQNVVTDIDQVALVSVVMGSDVQSRSVTATVHSHNELLPVPNATIVVRSMDGENSTQSNEDGEFTFNSLSMGIVRFDISASGYNSAFYFENITNSADNLQFKLIKEPTYSITIEVLNPDQEPLDGITVTFNNIALTTNQYGIVIFSDILKGTYTYKVEAEGYEFVEAEVNVTQDENIVINLISTAIKVVDTKHLVHIWPNPFSDFINVEVTIEGFTNLTIEIFSITGQKVRTLVDNQFIQGTYNFKWAPTDTPNMLVSQGLYIIKVTTREGVVAKRAIFSPRSR